MSFNKGVYREKLKLLPPFLLSSLPLVYFLDTPSPS